MKNNYYLNLNSSPLQSRKLNNRLKKKYFKFKNGPLLPMYDRPDLL